MMEQLLSEHVSYHLCLFPMPAFIVDLPLPLYRLVAFITISRPADSGRPTYTCHVFETDSGGEEICQSLSVAAEICFQAMLKTRMAGGAGEGYGGEDMSLTPGGQVTGGHYGS